MQEEDKEDSDKIAMYFWSGIYHEPLKGFIEPYSHLQKTISIVLLTNIQFPDCNNYHSKYVLYDLKHEHELPEILELHFFEIPKAEKEQQEDKKHLWLKLINADSKEDLDNLSKDRTEDFLKKGVQAVNNMNANTDFRTIVRMREEAMHEKASMLEEAEQKGMEIGIEKGIAEEQHKAVAFMRRQGVPEEVIQNYLSRNKS